VAVNRQIVIRAQWQYHVLQAQDSIDVVRAIGGG
jgi:thiamine biosynthesis protein ThiS